MNVASLELSRELYELSNWNETRDWYKTWSGEGWEIGSYEADCPELYPAYSLDYLLRKFPDVIELRHGNLTRGLWRALKLPEGFQSLADTPEDAACKLAIALFKSNILQKGSAA